MKISAVLGMWMCVVFALVCYGVAYNGFAGFQSLTDPVERDASLGYAWFWAFLGAIATVFGVLSWMIKAGKIRSEH
jgi:H+/Cl- antiporter ClcA